MPLLKKNSSGLVMKLPSGLAALECCCGANCDEWSAGFIAKYEVYIRLTGGAYYDAGFLTCCETTWEAAYGGVLQTFPVGSYEYELTSSERCINGAGVHDEVFFDITCFEGVIHVQDVRYSHQQSGGFWTLSYDSGFAPGIPVPNPPLDTWVPVSGLVLTRTGGSTTNCYPTTIPTVEIMFTLT